MAFDILAKKVDSGALGLCAVYCVNASQNRCCSLNHGFNHSSSHALVLIKGCLDKHIYSTSQPIIIRILLYLALTTESGNANAVMKFSNTIECHGSILDVDTCKANVMQAYACRTEKIRGHVIHCVFVDAFPTSVVSRRRRSYVTHAN